MLQPIIWLLYGAILYITIFLLLVFLENGRLMDDVEWLEEWPSITVVIPAYNEEDSIEMTIESVLSVDYPRDKLEVIVVDDGSEDKTEERARNFEDNDIVQVISQENQGKGGALNTGLEHAEGDFLACADADSKLAENSLKNLVSGFDEDTGAIASAMKVRNPKNMLQKIQWVEYMVGIFMRNIMGAINAIHVTPGPLSVYRTSLLRDLGGFDEESIVEDQEICFRFQKHHWKVAHSRKGEVYTIAPDNFKDLYHQRKRWYRGSLDNIMKYKEMVLNSKYGDFGIFGLTSKLIMGVLSIMTLFIMLYMTLTPVFQTLVDYMEIGLEAINFSILPENTSLFLNEIYWSLISIRMTTVLMIGTMFTLSIFLAYLAAVHTEEKLFSQGIFPTFIYLTYYVFFIGFMWLVVFVEMILDIENGW